MKTHTHVPSLPRAIALAVALALHVPAVFAAPAPATPGARDTTFNGGGVAFADMNGNDRGNAAAIQPDGKIVVSGCWGNTAPRYFGLLRYNADGSLDTSFSGDGNGGAWMPSNAAPADSCGTTVAVLPDGKIVQGGVSGTDFGLARFNSDGTLDPTFGTNGTTTSDVGGKGVTVTAMVVQPDGKVLLAGYVTVEDYYGDDDDRVILRYNANGTLDTTFDGDGKLILTHLNNQERINAMALQPDGKIVVVGSTATWDQAETNPPYLEVRRYNSDGTLDTTFGGTGAVGYYGHQAGSEGRAVAVQPDGMIVVGGYGLNDNGVDREMLLLRYDNGAIIDTAFNRGGKIVSFASADGVRALALLPDGRIVAAGERLIYNNISETWDVTLLSVNADGSFDVDFDTDGSAFYDLSGLDDRANAIAVQPNGRVVVVGNGFNGTNDDFVLLRVHAYPTSWDLTPSAFTFTDAAAANASAVQISDAITIAGLGSVEVPVLVSGGEYSIDNGAFTTMSGYVHNGSTIRVRHTTASAEATTTSTVLTVGGLSAIASPATVLGTTGSDTFSSITVDAPDAFSFAAQTDVATSTTITSATVTLAGLSSTTPISVSGGEYAINGGTFTAAAGVVGNGDQVAVRHTSAGSTGTDVTTTVTIGGVSATFTSTTAGASGSGGDGGGSGGGGGGGALNLGALLLLAAFARRRS